MSTIAHQAVSLPSYVLITPARDERAFIELALQSVVAQTVLPLRWIVVSDGSTDGTDEIVAKYSAEYNWIELVRMPERTERHFAGKVDAFNAGYARVSDLPYDVLGNLDADVSFEPDFFAFLLAKFAACPKLGVAGAAFSERGSQYDYRFTSIEHVSGPCQLFRRQCFEEIGGYHPRKIGGIDLVAVISARMKNWRTQTFTEKMYLHHRHMGTALAGRLMVPFRVGKADYVLGSHPLWQLFRSMYQTTRHPLIVSGVLRFIGFFWAMMSGTKQEVQADFIRFRRGEQMERLRKFVMKESGLHSLVTNESCENTFFGSARRHAFRAVAFILSWLKDWTDAL